MYIYIYVFVYRSLNWIRIAASKSGQNRYRFSSPCVRPKHKKSLRQTTPATGQAESAGEGSPCGSLQGLPCGSFQAVFIYIYL